MTGALIPEEPLGGPRGDAEVLPRFEDVTQDGRVMVPLLMQGVGAAVWRAQLARHPAVRSLRDQGVFPILRRIAVVSEGGPFSVDEPLHVEGTWQLAREREEDGDRIFLNMWVEATARSATTFGPRPAPHAPRVRVGRVFAEHVMTRPFAPANARRVTRLEAEGLPAIAEARHRFEPAEALLALAGRAPADLDPHPDEVTFGLLHTDANQHVNSLVYPRRFEEAAVARLTRADGPGLETRALVTRGLEVRFRKPCFAGETVPLAVLVRSALAAPQDVVDARVLAVGAFGPAENPRATLAAWMG